MLMRMRKRSIWAAGRRKVLSDSTGFWVASTRKGSGRGKRSPSMEICRSSMASSRADWVRGMARLISSASRRLVITGPCRSSKSPVFWLKIRMPMMSLGSMSGTNWMRPDRHPRAREMALTRVVLPTPGRSSSSTWPSASTAMIISRIRSDFPTMIFSVSCSIACANLQMSMIPLLYARVFPCILGGLGPAPCPPGAPLRLRAARPLCAQIRIASKRNFYYDNKSRKKKQGSDSFTQGILFAHGVKKPLPAKGERHSSGISFASVPGASHPRQARADGVAHGGGAARA